MFRRTTAFLTIGLAIFAIRPGLRAQLSGPAPTPTPPRVEKIGENLFRVDRIRVDTANRQMSVPGTINSHVTTLEFVANMRGGLKAYESALTLDSDAVTFNAALVLLGLDKAHARLPENHFDPAAVKGDAVELWIECPKGECQRMRIERLTFDQTTKESIPDGPWVYTGSTFLPGGVYRAQLDGVLIGFVHDPSAIIEYSAGAGLGNYGSIVMNPNLGVLPGTAITLTVRALGAK
jgi:hypothetical protein